MNVLIVALAPVFIIALYIYFRDKYEKEPLGLLLQSLLAGAFIVLPITFVESWLSGPKFTSFSSGPFYSAFVVAGFTEEFFKYLMFIFLIWRNRNFNEKFDGIVYAVFISLGFAAIENVFYILKFGQQVAFLRAFTAVPAHALFGITMGYYFSLARFFRNKFIFLLLSLVYPIVLHGIYDYLLMAGNNLLLLLFIPFVIYLWYSGLQRMKKLS